MRRPSRKYSSVSDYKRFRDPAGLGLVPVSCGDDGRVYASRSAWMCAHQDGKCLPEHTIESVLRQLPDGVWALR